MLQQTQVPRVIEKYKSFLKKFSSARALAKAPLSDVLKEWSGLGYNRRGKYLHDAAKKIVGKYHGNFKEALLHPLPGLGPYTKSAVRVFAFNQPDVMIETNIRTVFIHHFFEGSKLIHDRELKCTLQKAMNGQDPRKWHWALMDYGAHLKKSGVRNNARGMHYTKQSKFEGSLRQVRGAILRELQNESLSEATPRRRLEASPRGLLKKALEGLERDGLIKKEKGKWRIA